MKKIVIDARGYQTTTGRYMRKLIEYLEILETKQTEREYIVLLHKKEFGDYIPKNKQFSKLEANFPHYGFTEQIEFLKFINNIKADLVHFTMPQQPVFYRGKHITTMHDLTLVRVFPGNKNWFIYHLKQMAGKFIFKRIANTSAHIITPSEYTKQDYAKFANIDLNKITVTPESADVSTQKPTPYPPLFDKLFILYVGQQSNYKNLRRLIQAHQQLLTTLPELHLVFVGKMNLYGEQTKAWAEQQGYKNIVYTGFVNDAELAWLYKNCGAYVYPSLMEGFGLPGLEAMSYGAPVVSSNATSLPEVYGDAAHYFNPEDTDEMTQKIKDVLTDEKLRKKLVANGQKQLKKYSWERMAKQTLDVYMSALKSKQARK